MTLEIIQCPFNFFIRILMISKLFIKYYIKFIYLYLKLKPKNPIPRHKKTRISQFIEIVL